MPHFHFNHQVWRSWSHIFISKKSPSLWLPAPPAWPLRWKRPAIKTSSACSVTSSSEMTRKWRMGSRILTRSWCAPRGLTPQQTQNRYGTLECHYHQCWFLNIAQSYSDNSSSSFFLIAGGFDSKTNNRFILVHAGSCYMLHIIWSYNKQGKIYFKKCI